MIKEYVVKITNKVLPNAFTLFEEEYSPEQEIVRCKDCKRHQENNCEVLIGTYAPDWFCADGERRDNDA